MSRTLDILDRLISFPTISAASNLDLIGYARTFLSELGFQIHTVPDTTGQKAGLFASLGPSGAGVMLSAHSDVVPVTGQPWTKDPFKLSIEEGRAYGRGTTDMKGFLASVLALAERAAAAPLKEPLKIALSYDEEIGCIGIRDMIGQLQPAIGLPRICIVGEPTSMRVATGHKGKAALRAICHGMSGHSAMAPEFLNALHPAADLVAELRGVQDDLAQNGARDAAYGVPYSTVHVGKLSGGTALNIVPDRAELDFEFRHLAADRPEDIRARIHAAADRVEARYKARFPSARIEVQDRNAYPGLDTEPQSPVVDYVSGLADGAALTKVAFGTEAGYFDALGVPTVVCGPGSMDGQGHKPDEYVELSELAKCDAMLDRLLVDLKA